MEGSAFPECRVTTPTPEQLHAVLMNFYKPLRTPDAKLVDAIQHTKQSEMKRPDAVDSNRAGGGLSNATRHANNST